MVNEPGSYQNLEWIELYADSSEPVSLDEYVVVVNEQPLTVPPGTTMEPGEYLILCRKLVSDDGNASFEAHWGDSSGVWGDCEAERAIRTPVVAEFKLKNSVGSIQIRQGDVLVSELDWPSAGDDGVSWERLNVTTDEVHPCVEASGSTPGRTNSRAPVANDLAIARVNTTAMNGSTRVTIVVANRGVDETGLANVALSLGGGELLANYIVGYLQPGDSSVYVDDFVLPGMRAELTAMLPEDGRASNNEVVFYAPGAEFPPVVITEIMADPEGNSDDEWVELKNVHYASIDLNGWQVGDYRKLCPISDVTMMLAPDERLVLVNDSDLFRGEYPISTARLIQPACWAQLNNGGDTVLLVDSYGLEADRVAYAGLPESGHTLCRGESDYADRWGPSVESGGSPGQVNAVLFSGEDGSLTLTIEPALISPDGDGVDDSALITIAAPEMDEFVLRIYDREGRVVHSFDTASERRNNYAWHGGVERGRRLPIGLYVVYFEVPGIGSVKKPVVIAR